MLERYQTYRQIVKKRRLMMSIIVWLVLLGIFLIGVILNIGMQVADWSRMLETLTESNLRKDEIIALQENVIEGLRTEVHLLQSVLEEDIFHLDEFNREYGYVIKMPLVHKMLVVEECKKYGIDEHLVFALIRQESSNNPLAVSPTGARGYGQFIFETARWIYEDIWKLGTYHKDMTFDPVLNIKMTVWYMSYLLKVRNGDVEGALRHYNGFDDPNFVENVMRYYKNQ